MKSTDGFAFGLASGAALLIGAFGFLQDDVPPRRSPVLPLLTLAGTPRQEPVSAAVRAGADRRAELAAKIGGPWPVFAKGVIVHPLFCDKTRLPADDGGPEFHWIFGPGGSFERTTRLDPEKPSTPPGIPDAIGATVLHAAIVGPPGNDPARMQRVRDFWSYAVERFGPAAVRFSFEVPGASSEPPSEFRPAEWVSAAVEAPRKGER